MSRLADFLSQPGVAVCTDTSKLTRGLYSTDASIYRVLPQAVAAPRDAEELSLLVRAALESGLPITARGAGTSVAGNAVGEGLILDLAKHLNVIHDIDPDERIAVVDPGVVQASLQRAAEPHGLRFGPDPSTHTRCTIGGMIANNACGPRALGYGRSSDNVLGMELLTGNGETLQIRNDHTGTATEGLRQIVSRNLGCIRTEFGHFSRQVSGYSLEHLLPEHGFQIASFLAGTEGTLGVMSRATVKLVADPAHRLLVVLGYPSMAEAADAMPAVLAFSPTACEGIDRRIVDVVAVNRGPAAVPQLPRGEGWIFVELAGDDPAGLQHRAKQLVTGSGAVEGWAINDPRQAAALWRIREDGAGLAGVSLSRPAWAGWEDAAVPPERLGSYLRAFDELLTEHGLHALPYGHFGDGCVHCRIDFPFDQEGGTARYREFIVQAARLVAGFGGSMSGEHGDGRARSELLPAMYSRQALDLFGAVKAEFDPRNLMNPGVLVDPQPIDANIRMAAARTSPLMIQAPDFVRDAHRCTGVGKCLANNTASGGVMCPSYLATGDEKDSTRGRARILQEMVNGSLISDGWRSPEVHQALDLCLSCKGCGRDCPTGVDMASYKSRVLHESFRGRLRPRTHYALGWLPRWGRMVTRLPGMGLMANLGTQTPGLKNLVRAAAGVDQRRPMPTFRVAGSARRAHRRTVERPDPGPEVVIWVDSFTDSFTGTALPALIQLLEHAGHQVSVLQQTACCGLTWITTGQFDGARRQLRAALDVLAPIAERGVPIVGMEPSCVAVWRSDAAELLDDPRVASVSSAIVTLAELLSDTEGWQPPDLSGHTIVAQPHCHHASVLGWAADQRILDASGAHVVTVGGCCGLAGNFGVEQGHYEVSVAVAEHDLLPAVRAAGEDAIVLADGFSCRKQLSDLESRQAVTLAELLLTHTIVDD